MRIRRAVPSDAAALERLFDAWGHPSPARAIGERLAALEALPRAEVLVAEIDGTVAGFVGVSAVPHLARHGSFARLTGLSVSAGHRRRGVGAALMRAAEDLARGWGCDRMEVTSSRSRAEAPGFYPALGYEDRSDRQARFVRQL